MERIIIEVTEKGRRNPVPLDRWLAESGLVSDVGVAKYIATACCVYSLLLVRLPEFNDAIHNYMRAIGNHTDSASICALDKWAEQWYRCALSYRPYGSTKPNASQSNRIETAIRKYAATQNIDVRDVNRICALSVYRHQEFYLKFEHEGCSVKFTLFAYALPQLRLPPTEWYYHKASIEISTKKHPGMYQTCRWYACA